MKKLYLNSSKSILILTIFTLLFSLSCQKDKKETEPTEDKWNVSGEWEFILSPDNSFQDTTTIKGIKGSEQEEYATTIEKIFLYQNKSGEIRGDNAFFYFTGSISNKELELKVFNRRNGEYKPDEETSNLDHISTMLLKIDDFGQMSGTGTYLNNPDYDNAEQESYFVTAKKRGEISSNGNNFKNSQEDATTILCNISSSIDSWLISNLSDNTFRPIGNCYLEKDGGGYYLFGRYGPGSILPIYTQTIYYPFEWSWCKVRKYNFDINLEGEVRSIEALKWLVENQPPKKNFHSAIGFETLDLLNAAIDDFTDKYGGFAISFGYSLRTKNLSIYVNHTNGNSNEAKNHTLVKTIANSVSPHVNKIYYFAGHNISDHWYLRRSEFGTCNTSLLFCYVIGTHQVEYN